MNHLIPTPESILWMSLSSQQWTDVWRSFRPHLKSTETHRLEESKNCVAFQVVVSDLLPYYLCLVLFFSLHYTLWLQAIHRGHSSTCSQRHGTSVEYEWKTQSWGTAMQPATTNNVDGEHGASTECAREWAERERGASDLTCPHNTNSESCLGFRVVCTLRSLLPLSSFYWISACMFVIRCRPPPL